jgi:hypothetical protein
MEPTKLTQSQIAFHNQLMEEKEGYEKMIQQINRHLQGFINSIIAERNLPPVPGGYRLNENAEIVPTQSGNTLIPNRLEAPHEDLPS